MSSMFRIGIEIAKYGVCLCILGIVVIFFVLRIVDIIEFL